jgi:GTP-dependent phosphoenolpyruvate carboxykinase
MLELLDVDVPAWQQELKDVDEFLQRFGDRLPAELSEQRRRISQRLG